MHMNSPENPEQTTDRSGTRVPDTVPHGKEPFIEDRLTWRTLDLPPGAPPAEDSWSF